MTPEIILAAYPGAQQSIAWCERYLSPTTLDAEDMWPGLRDLEPSEALQVIRETIEESIAEGEAGRLTEALEQLNTTDFRRYLAAKLGAL